MKVFGLVLLVASCAGCAVKHKPARFVVPVHCISGMAVQGGCTTDPRQALLVHCKDVVFLAGCVQVAKPVLHAK